MTKHKYIRSNFTLVEMIMSIVIISIIAAISFTVFGSNNKSEINAASRKFSTKLHLARQYAITNRKFVAVLLPQGDETGFPSALKHYGKSAFVICIVDSSHDFQSYIGNEKWTIFSNDSIIHLNEDYNVISNPSRSDGVDDNANDTVFEEISEIDGVPFQTSATASTTVDDIPAIVFRPNGMGTGLHFFGFLATSCLTQQGGVALKARGHVRVILPQDLLADH